MEKKERTELKKWNKHANAGHFPSLSLRAECKCADLTVRACACVCVRACTRAVQIARERGWKKYAAGRGGGRRGRDFLFFRVAFVHCRVSQTPVVTNAQSKLDAAAGLLKSLFTNHT